MSPEHSSDVKFEIGHVLFIDIVGYSKMFINHISPTLFIASGFLPLRGDPRFEQIVASLAPKETAENSKK